MGFNSGFKGLMAWSLPNRDFSVDGAEKLTHRTGDCRRYIYDPKRVKITDSFVCDSRL